MRITVTQQDIEQGKRRDEQSCPVALACKRAGLSEPRVDNYYVSYISREDGSFSFLLPQQVKNFIIAFDNQKSVQPFNFDLRD